MLRSVFRFFLLNYAFCLNRNRFLPAAVPSKVDFSQKILQMFKLQAQVKSISRIHRSDVVFHKNPNILPIHKAVLLTVDQKSHFPLHISNFVQRSYSSNNCLTNVTILCSNINTNICPLSSHIYIYIYIYICAFQSKFFNA